MQQRIEITLNMEPGQPEGKLSFKVQTTGNMTSLKMLHKVTEQILEAEAARQAAQPIAPRRPGRVGGILLPDGPIPNGG